MDFSHLDAMSGAYQEARILQTAVELDLFPAIGDGADSAAVAAARGLEPRACELFLNALVAVELLEKADGVFTLAAVSRAYLLPDSATYFGHMVGFESDGWHLWTHLGEALKTGAPVRTPDMWQRNPEDTRRFIMAMHSLVSARGDADFLAGILDLTGVSRLLDVGSGPGTYPIALCKRHPELSATIFDLPGTLGVTKDVLVAEGMDRRIELVGGDYNQDPLPGGFDAVFLSNIIHGEDDAGVKGLIAKCFDALVPGGRIIVKDHILNREKTHPACGAVFSLHMLLATRGRDYSFDEVAGWMADAGFAAPTETPLSPTLPSSLMVASRPL